MADRQFTYKVDIDTASAKAAAAATRAMFAQSISGVGGAGGQGGTASVRQMANFEISESHRVANARINDIKRVWAVEKAEATNAMAAVRRQSGAGADGAGAAGGGSQLQGVLKTGFLAYGAYLAGRQAVEGTVEFGKVGAQQLRMVETFKQLGDQIGVNADDMAQAVKTATNSSISDMQAMQFSANILAQRFSSEIDDIEGDTAILATASRRLAQVYTDEEGKLLSTEAVFSRLVKFAREGNKELVDQFGLSNELIAQTLGIPNEGLRGAEGAANRWKGMVTIMAQELERLGQPTDSLADQMEQDFARITTAMDKLRQATAVPISIAIEAAAGATEGIAGFLADWQNKSNAKNAAFFGSKALSDFWGDQIGGLRVPGGSRRFASDDAKRQEAAFLAMQERMQIDVPAFGATEEENERFAQLAKMGLETSKAFVELSGSFSANTEKGQEALRTISAITDQFATGEPSLTTTIRLYNDLLIKLQEIAEMEANLEFLKGGDKEYTPPDKSVDPALRDMISRRRISMVGAGEVPIEGLTEEERKFRLAVGGNREQVEILEYIFANLATSAEDLYDVFASLVGARRSLEDEQNQLRDAIRGKVGGYRQAQLGVAMAGTDTAGQLALLQGFGETLREGSLEALANQEKVAGLQMRLADEGAREWKKTAKEVERLFESAADKIMSMPGIKSATPVTSRQLLETRYGVYKDQPDEFVRQARDELIEAYRMTDTDEYGNVTERLIPRTTTDYPEVTRERIEEIAGAPPGLPGDVLLPLFEDKFYSGAAFADPANLDLLNMDAIRGQYEDMKAGETGRKNQQEFIMKELGVSAADAALITGQQAPIVQMLTGGQSEEEISKQLGGTLKSIMGIATGEMEFGKPALAAWKDQFGKEDIVKGLEGLGKTAALNFFKGFSDSIGESGFAAAIVAAVKTDISKWLTNWANANS